MTLTITLTRDHGLVLLSALGAGLTVTMIGGRVGQQRQAAGVPYPYLYADQSVAASNSAAYKFNCAQRGHQNLLETLPLTLSLLLMAGVEFPKLAAGCGVLYALGAMAFYANYARGVPAQRHDGFAVLCRVAPALLTVLTFYSGVKLVLT
mmetsp:Transcript_34111/g.83646  ORF Transcript_34111/g.83646 Transcript_34111/m.83646 type:complete len:150 (+) Transcript_34111:75-524(+)